MTRRLVVNKGEGWRAARCTARHPSPSLLLIGSRVIANEVKQPLSGGGWWIAGGEPENKVIKVDTSREIKIHGNSCAIDGNFNDLHKLIRLQRGSSYQSTIYIRL